MASDPNAPRSRRALLDAAAGGAAAVAATAAMPLTTKNSAYTRPGRKISATIATGHFRKPSKLSSTRVIGFNDPNVTP